MFLGGKALSKRITNINFEQHEYNNTEQLLRAKIITMGGVRETRQLSMPRWGAGSNRKARLNLAPPFHSLIMRLIHPVTYATILPYDLLLRQPDGEIEPEREGGVGDCLKAANQHACVIGPGLDSVASGRCVSVFIKSAI